VKQKPFRVFSNSRRAAFRIRFEPVPMQLAVHSPLRGQFIIDFLDASPSGKWLDCMDFQIGFGSNKRSGMARVK
jgi:hypothetical protein